MKMPGNAQDQHFKQSVLENGESATWEVMIWLKEWIDREKF